MGYGLWIMNFELIFLPTFFSGGISEFPKLRRDLPKGGRIQDSENSGWW